MTPREWVATFGAGEAYLDAARHSHDDCRDLLIWAVEDCADSPLYEDMVKRALIAITWNSPDCDPHWRRLATYTLTRLDPRNDLTSDERRIRAIAESVYVAEQRAARRLGIDLYPTDSEDAYERALVELTPFLRQETKQ
jgi:hypothetical protein